jgi:glucose-6-phosphate 1-epimerase
LVRARISAPEADAEIYLQGAHLTRWTPKGERPVLFLSPNSAFTQGKAIRGGVPIIFPWFGARADGKPGPAHGFARTIDWDVEFVLQQKDGSVQIALALGSNETSLRFRVTVGKNLELELDARNDLREPLTFEEALDTYLAVSDIREISVSGLEGTEYLDKADGFQRKHLGDERIRFTKETDQVHANTSSTCVIDDPLWDRRIVIAKSGSNSTVVWNPWSDKASAMADLGPDAWTRMICVESGNIGENSVTLAPGASHSMTVAIRVVS